MHTCAQEYSIVTPPIPTHIAARNLIDRISTAFPINPAPAESSLFVPNNAEEWQNQQVRPFRGRRWTELALDDLSGHTGAFYSFTPEAFCYYLPALLCAALPVESESGNRARAREQLQSDALWSLCLSGSDVLVSKGWQRKQLLFEGIIKNQASVIADYLDFVFANADAFHARYKAACGMERYWGSVEGKRAEARRAFFYDLTHWVRPTGLEPDCETLFQLIEAAFSEAPCPADHQITYSGSPDQLDIDLDFRGKHWRGLDPEFIISQQSALSFFRPEAMRFFLPAFLFAALANFSDNEIDQYLVHHFVTMGDSWFQWQSQKFSCLSQSEREAVAAYLRYQQKPKPCNLPGLLADDPVRGPEMMRNHRDEEEERWLKIELALENYWLK